MNENLIKLRELTPNLGSIVSETNLEKRETIYNTKDGGTFIGFGLHHEGSMAVQRVFMSKGTRVPEHHHEEQEYCIVYKGLMRLDMSGWHAITSRLPQSGEDVGDQILRPGDAVYFPPNVPHTGTMLEDTWILSISIPSAEGYPE